MKEYIVATNIIVDKPTGCGNIYPREVVEKAIESFNKRSRASNGIVGGILNRLHIQRTDEETHKTLEMFINESGVLCAKIKMLECEASSLLLEKMSSGIVARPVMSLPAYVYDEQAKHDVSNPFTIGTINEILKVQLEYNDRKAEDE